MSVNILHFRVTSEVAQTLLEVCLLSVRKWTRGHVLTIVICLMAILLEHTTEISKNITNTWKQLFFFWPSTAGHRSFLIQNALQCYSTSAVQLLFYISLLLLPQGLWWRPWSPSSLLWGFWRQTEVWKSGHHVPWGPHHTTWSLRRSGETSEELTAGLTSIQIKLAIGNIG